MSAPLVEVKHFRMIPVEFVNLVASRDIAIIVIHLQERGLKFRRQIHGQGGLARCAESCNGDDGRGLFHSG